MTLPPQRPRRLRRTPALRRLVAETRLAVDDLVAPLFVREGIDEPQPIALAARASCSTPASRCARRSRELADLGVPGGDPVRRARAQGRRRAARPGTPTASCRWRSRDLRDELGDGMVLMADLCLDEYTDHGHCGVLDRRRRGRQRRHPRAATPQVAVAQADGGRRRRRAQRDDGRPGRRHPRRPRRRRPRRHRDPRLRGQVRLGPLRPVPRRGRRHDRRRRRPQGLPAGLAQRAARRWPRSAPTSPRAPTW